MAGQLEGKIALITGGSSGIGRASALIFAREGARVAIADVDVEGAQETLRMIEAGNDKASFFKTDVSKAQEVDRLFKGIASTYGRLDCAFNNAGVESASATTVDCTEELWDRTMNTNLKGVWLCMKHEIMLMLKTGGGAIVNNSSILGLIGFAEQPAYVASKHGVIGITKAAALEYARSGIRINALCPGQTRTPLLERRVGGWDSEATKSRLAHIPMARLGRPEEIGEAALWLCTEAASFVTGHALTVDGGYVAA